MMNNSSGKVESGREQLVLEEGDKKGLGRGGGGGGGRELQLQLQLQKKKGWSRKPKGAMNG